MLSTCSSCHRRDCCGNCKHKDDCFWLRVAPPADVNRCFSCGAFECAHYDDCRYIWDLEQVKRWGRAPASERQINLIRRKCKGFDPAGLTKGEASQILNRVM